MGIKTLSFLHVLQFEELDVLYFFTLKLYCRLAQASECFCSEKRVKNLFYVSRTDSFSKHLAVI